MFDESIDDIPSAAAPLDKLLCCDVCMRKDDKFILAQIYCMICKTKFCAQHEKVKYNHIYRYIENEEMINLTKLV